MLLSGSQAESLPMDTFRFCLPQVLGICWRAKVQVKGGETLSTEALWNLPEEAPEGGGVPILTLRMCTDGRVVVGRGVSMAGEGFSGCSKGLSYFTPTVASQRKYGLSFTLWLELGRQDFV